MRRYDIDDLLARLEAKRCTREEWRRVGAALKNGGGTLAQWIRWSMLDPDRFHEGECERLWEGFSDDIGLGTLVYIARQHGVVPEALDRGDGSALAFDDDITVDASPLASSTDTFRAAGGEWDRVGELSRFLEALEPNDRFRYVTRFHADEGGKLCPGRGFIDRTVGEILADLDKYGDIPSALGEGDPEAGALCGVNPVEGGVGDRNVTAFRNCLVECDEQTLDEQMRLIRRLNLPARAIVYSGHKSIHVLVRVDAHDKQEYDARVAKVYEQCELAGLRVDHACKNASRMMRLPGFERGGRRQTLIATSVGAPSFAEWVTWLEAHEEPRLPATVNLASALPERPPLREELIDRVLRRTHKLIISGPSKAGKSFALIELCVAVATGGEWLGFACHEGTTLYINMELDPASCLERFHQVAAALGLSDDVLGHIDVLNLRGLSAPLDELASEIIARIRYERQHYDLVVIDPIYKCLTGDENSATEMARMVRAIDLISTELECAVAYSHHYAKGAPGQKEPLDRMSGSGVFARDPDAILDLCPLKVGADQQTQSGHDPDDPTPAFRLTLILREFKSPRPVDVWFEHPLHSVDATGVLAGCREVGKPGRPKGSGGGGTASANGGADQLAALLGDGEWHHKSELAEAMRVSEKTVERRAKADPRFEWSRGRARAKR